MPFYLGKGIKGANGVEFYIYGHYLPNDLSAEIASSGLTGPWSIMDSTTSFDVSSLTADHEVVVALFVSTNTTTTSSTYYFNWYRERDNALVFTSNYTNPPSGPGASSAAWIGWLSEDPGSSTYPLYKEIQENGNYRVAISVTGGESASQTLYFSVTGIPAQTVLFNPAATSLDWTVRVSNYFKTSNYIRAGVCLYPFTDGQSAEPSGILDYVNAPSSNPGAAATGTLWSLDANETYTVYGFAQAANGLYYQTGSATESTETVRPENFSWTTPKTSGGDFNLTAAEWNSFTARIDEFRAYVYGYSNPYFFPIASPGQEFSAFSYNYAINGMSSLSPTIPLPPSKTSANYVEAALLNALVSSLNSIP